MVLFANVVAAFGLLLPIFLVLGLRSTAEREPWEIALDIPATIALDLLVVLALTLVLRLEQAAVVSRVLYLVAAGAIASRRRRSPPRWPHALKDREIGLLVVAVCVALAISMQISRRWVVWDRGWHIPLVGSLRGQRLPFHNVFNASEVLHYHFSGDVHASMLQTLSGGVLHASLALSLAHDLHFGLTGLLLALFMISWGYRARWEHALGTAALLLAGPVHLFRENVRTPQEGYNFLSFLSFSFRPHTALGALLMLGFVGAIVSRLDHRDDLPLEKTAPLLVACAAGLSITEETSLGVLGLTLGLTWLCAPRVIHERRTWGLAVFLALLAALVLPNLVFSASLSPGGEHHVFKIVPWRSPGYYREVLPLSTPRGRFMLGYDLFGPAAIGFGAIVHAARRRSRGRGVLAAFFFTFLAISTLALTRIDVDGHSLESHRFATAVFVIGPFVALALLSPRFPAVAPVPRRATYPAAAMLAGMVAGPVSTLDWVVYFAPNWCAKHHDFGVWNFYEINCRDMVKRSSSATRHAYVSKPLFFLGTGCVPTFAPGYAFDSYWKAITIGHAYEGFRAIAEIRKAHPEAPAIPALCPAPPDGKDPVCALAEARGWCEPAGAAARACSLPMSEAARLPAK
jgi:hypothetical protein